MYQTSACSKMSPVVPCGDRRVINIWPPLGSILLSHRWGRWFGYYGLSHSQNIGRRFSFFSYLYSCDHRVGVKMLLSPIKLLVSYRQKKESKFATLSKANRHHQWTKRDQNIIYMETNNIIQSGNHWGVWFFFYDDLNVRRRNCYLLVAGITPASYSVIKYRNNAFYNFFSISSTVKRDNLGQFLIQCMCVCWNQCGQR